MGNSVLECLANVKLKFMFRTRNPHKIKFNLKQALLIGVAPGRGSLVQYRQWAREVTAREIKPREQEESFLLGGCKGRVWG